MEQLDTFLKPSPRLRRIQQHVIDKHIQPQRAEASHCMMQRRDALIRYPPKISAAVALRNQMAKCILGKIVIGSLQLLLQDPCQGSFAGLLTPFRRTIIPFDIELVQAPYVATGTSLAPCHLVTSF